MKDFLIFLLFLCVWPGTMFLVGMIGESRILPVGTRQSRAFLPGELTIPVMEFAIYLEYKKGFRLSGINWLWLIVAIAVIIPIGIKLWRDDINWYKPRARYSPTKIWHNLGGFILVPIIIATNVLGIATDIVRGQHRFSWVSLVLFACALAFYIYCAATDSLADPGDVDIRHPEDWQPIWVTLAQKRST